LPPRSVSRTREWVAGRVSTVSAAFGLQGRAAFGGSCCQTGKGCSSKSVNSEHSTPATSGPAQRQALLTSSRRRSHPLQNSVREPNRCNLEPFKSETPKTALYVVLAQGRLTLQVVCFGPAHFQLPVRPPKSCSPPTDENPGRPWEGLGGRSPLDGAGIFIAQKHDNQTNFLNEKAGGGLVSIVGTDTCSSLWPCLSCGQDLK
jgi:hypothetical protein